MTDSGHFHINKTTPLKRTLPDFGSNKKSWFLFGLGGCGLFLCIATVIVSGFIIYSQSTDDGPGLAGNGTVTPLIDLLPLPGATKPPATHMAPVKTATISAVETVEVILTSQPAQTPVPRFGPICFRAVIDEIPSLDCLTSFPPTIVEVHAIFDYTGMVPQKNNWSRIWYHNGFEVLKVQEAWTADVTGQFDYNLNTTDGRPLSPGTWELELYVDGVLQTYSAFVVGNPVTPKPGDTTATPVSPPPASTDYRLAFTKWDGRKHAVWTSDLDGNNQRFLLDFAASPMWSPDGQSLAFFGEEGIDNQPLVQTGTNGLWRIDADGQSPRQLLPEGTAHTVAWSPDGTLIAFDAARGGPDRRIYFIDAEGSPQPFELLGEQPSFAPDSLQVVAKACRPDCGLWIVNRDDSNPRRLTTEGTDGLPAWSPDGAKIAFSRNVDSNVDVYIIDADGSNLQRLTTAPGNDSVPAWTPDSRRIVFRSDRNGVWQIFRMNADGSDQQLIVDNVGAGDEWAFDRMSVR